MSTDLAQTTVGRHLPTAALRRTPRTRRPCIVVTESDPEMFELLGDIFAGDFEIIAAPDPVTIPDIDALQPDVILIGTVDRESQAGLTPDEIVALAARHMRLHSVPILILAADPNVLRDAERLAGATGVTVVSLPFDIETIECVLKSVARKATMSAQVRLGELCHHGFDVIDGACWQCA